MKEWNIGADASGRLADKPTGVETTNEVGSRLCKDRSLMKSLSNVFTQKTVSVNLTSLILKSKILEYFLYDGK